MSAIAKPMTHTTAALTDPSEMVNIEQCRYISKITVPKATSNSGSPIFGIEFRVSEGDRSGDPGVILWKYETEALRDNDYDRIISAFSTLI